MRFGSLELRRSQGLLALGQQVDGLVPESRLLRVGDVCLSSPCGAAVGPSAKAFNELPLGRLVPRVFRDQILGEANPFLQVFVALLEPAQPDQCCPNATM